MLVNIVNILKLVFLIKLSTVHCILVATMLINNTLSHDDDMTVKITMEIFIPLHTYENLSCMQECRTSSEAPRQCDKSVSSNDKCVCNCLMIMHIHNVGLEQCKNTCRDYQDALNKYIQCHHFA